MSQISYLLFGIITLDLQISARGLGVPGDVGLLAWYPRMDTGIIVPGAAADYQFVPSTANPDNESTSLIVWGQSPNPFSLTVVTYTFYEASIIPFGEQFTPPNIGPCDPSLAMRMLVSAFDAMPPAAIQRNVCKDDGDLQSLFQTPRTF
jgi:hypothetical protein